MCACGGGGLTNVSVYPIRKYYTAWRQEHWLLFVFLREHVLVWSTLTHSLSLRHFWHLFPAPATLLYDPYPPTANHNNPRLSCRPALLCFTLGLTDSQSAVGDTWTFCCILHFWAHGNEDRNIEFSRMKMRCDYGEIYIVNQGLITHKRKCLPERMIAGSYSFHTWLARCYTDISVLIYLFIYLFLLSFH